MPDLLRMYRGTAMFPPKPSLGRAIISSASAHHRQPTQTHVWCPSSSFTRNKPGGRIRKATCKRNDSQQRTHDPSSYHSGSGFLSGEKQELKQATNQPGYQTRCQVELAYPRSAGLGKRAPSLRTGKSLPPLRTRAGGNSQRRDVGKRIPKSTAKEGNPSTGED